MQNLQYAPLNSTQILDLLKSSFEDSPFINAAVLYGSRARGNASIHSDIDIYLLISTDFKPEDYKEKLSTNMELSYSLHLKTKNKLVLYPSNHPKIELSFTTSLVTMERYLKGSLIAKDKLEDCILYVDKSYKQSINTFLASSLTDSTPTPDIDNIINDFIYYFESSLTMQFRSDLYQCQYLYNLAVHKAIILASIVKGEQRFLHLPKKVTWLFDEKTKAIEDLYGPCTFSALRQSQGKLLEFFYKNLQSLKTVEEAQAIQQFCEQIYENAQIWNFRDAARINNALTKLKLFRGPALPLVPNQSFVQQTIEQCAIKTIIDLRAHREIQQADYKASSIQSLNYYSFPLDPWNQPAEFQAINTEGNNIIKAYRFFLLGCRSSIKNTLLTILKHYKEGAIYIHCVAGKDRTGIVFTILHLLSGASPSTVRADYLASEQDLTDELFDFMLEHLTSNGNIEHYLLGCGLQANEIQQLKNLLINDPS